MNKDEFYNTIQKIENCLSYYEYKNYENTKFDLDFANGEHISLRFNANSVPHLLGINIDALRSTGIYKDNAYQTLLDIVDNPSKLYNLINNGHIQYNQVFSDYLDEKINNFKSICGIRIFDLEFVVNYKKKKNLNSTEQLYDGYYLGYLKNSKLSVVGFTLNEKNNTYYPTTSLSFEQYSDQYNTFLNKLFANQTTTIVDTMKKRTFYDYGQYDKQSYYYSNHDKVNFLRNCKRYAETYGATTDTMQSNIFYVEKVLNLNEEKRFIAEIIEIVSEKIQNGKMIDVRQLQSNYDYPINDFILNLISAHNDSLVGKKDGNNSSDYSYKEIIEDYNECKQELQRIENLTIKLEEQNQKLQEQLSLVRDENTELKDEREQIKKILIK